MAANTNVIYKKSTLTNGLRVVTEKLPSVRSAAIGVWIDVGSRNEAPDDNGISHFIEHMVFKGTRKRSAKQIASSLESLGGSLNGFTSREQTCFTARILDEHIEDALDVLADMVCNPKMSTSDMSKERLVICEEIKESLDTPADHIHDLFARTYWGEHPLGQPIMGSLENVMKMTRRQTLEYRRNNYRAGSMIIAASGAVSHDKLVKAVRSKFCFEKGTAESASSAEPISEIKVAVVPRDSTQTHFCIGFPGFRYNCNERMATLCLSAYLGGGMSSVLFQKIREELGLAYQVFTYHDFYRDSGIFGAYLATDKAHLRQAYDVIMSELARVKRRRINGSALEQVKEQIKGHLTLGLESTSARMSRLARQEIHTGGYSTLRQALIRIEKVTASDMLEVANEIFDPSRMAIAVLGPVKEDVFRDVA
jgi:predicted Zn-dependent peptidase